MMICTCCPLDLLDLLSGFTKHWNFCLLYQVFDWTICLCTFCPMYQVSFGPSVCFDLLSLYQASLYQASLYQVPLYQLSWNLPFIMVALIFFLILNKIIQKSTIFNIECYDREHVSQIKVHKNNLIIAIKN